MTTEAISGAIARRLLKGKIPEDRESSAYFKDGLTKIVQGVLIELLEEDKDVVQEPERYPANRPPEKCQVKPPSLGDFVGILQKCTEKENVEMVTGVINALLNHK